MAQIRKNSKPIQKSVAAIAAARVCPVLLPGRGSQALELVDLVHAIQQHQRRVGIISAGICSDCRRCVAVDLQSVKQSGPTGEEESREFECQAVLMSPWDCRAVFA